MTNTKKMKGFTSTYYSKKDLIEMKCEFLSAMDGEINSVKEMITEVKRHLEREWIVVKRSYVGQVLRNFIY